MTWSSPVLPKLYSNDSSVNPFDKPITEDQESWISSLINIGAMIGPFPLLSLQKDLVENLDFYALQYHTLFLI